MPWNELVGAVFCIAWLLIQFQGVSQAPRRLEANIWYFCLKLHLQGPWTSHLLIPFLTKQANICLLLFLTLCCFWNTHNTFWVKVPLQKLPGRAWAQLYHWQKAHTLPLPLSPTLRMLPEATWSLPKRWDFKISGNDKKRKNEPGNLWWRHLTGSGGDRG